MPRPRLGSLVLLASYELLFCVATSVSLDYVAANMHSHRKVSGQGNHDYGILVEKEALYPR